MRSFRRERRYPGHTAKKDVLAGMESHSCPDEEMIDAYSVGKLAGRDLEIVEEHLLSCVGCQDRLTAADHFRDAVRAALVRERESETSAGRLKLVWTRIRARWLP